MKTFTSEELKKIIDLHGKWLGGEAGGERANLYGANLYGANLSKADLSRADLYGADLYGANLSGAYLSGADLSRADLSRADLSRADLFGANLSRANLSWVNLSEANLYGANLFRANLSGGNLSGAIITNCTGNSKEIKSLQVDGSWLITYTFNQLAIGCQQHSMEAWKGFSDEEIEEMDWEALKWWGVNKAVIFQILHLFPAINILKE